MPIIEITSENFYDYESKYTVGLSHHIIPARIDGCVKNCIETLAVETYCALNCNCLVRVDFMLDRDKKPYVVEINTIPGMTETSLVPDAARAREQYFPDLVSDIVELAMKKD